MPQQYFERTLQMKAALVEQPDLLKKIQSVFISHMANDGLHRPIGKGNSRCAYEIGECEVAPGIGINMLLKLKKHVPLMKYAHAANKCSKFSDLSEFGAFEIYYDFVAENISAVSFLSREGHEQYCEMFGNIVDHTFSLAEDWGGTKVARGDTGAIPYFQMVVQYKGLFGCLTEGESPLIKPKHTAIHRDTRDQCTVENGRIIDLDQTQCFLIDLDEGGHFHFHESHPNNLGLRRRGERYFHKEYRLDI